MTFSLRYRAKNPAGYCGLGGTGVACQIGLASKPDDKGRQRLPLLFDVFSS
ncbi:hypothetical protein [Bosea sp. AK1]|uniref:hypothetical protein n=1 Tax=Bosea sp. AK1 TaxID=2587160 RepID=UPI0013AFF1BC|nr:hypothetical protein [Bosea sp. AK1]